MRPLRRKTLADAPQDGRPRAVERLAQPDEHREGHLGMTGFHLLQVAPMDLRPLRQPLLGQLGGIAEPRDVAPESSLMWGDGFHTPWKGVHDSSDHAL